MKEGVKLRPRTAVQRRRIQVTADIDDDNTPRPQTSLDFAERPRSRLSGKRPQSGKCPPLCFADPTGPPSVSDTRVSTARSDRERGGALSRASRRSELQTPSSREGALNPTPNALRDMEAAFYDVDASRPGTMVWRIEGSVMRILEEKDFGFFHEGSAYLVFNITTNLSSNIHTWIGEFCKEQDAEIVDNKSQELDKLVATADILSREMQHNESICFMRCFPEGIVYLEGKHRTTINRASNYAKKMYEVKGRKYVRAACITPSKEALKPKSALVFDNYPRIYVWMGSQCGYVRRVKAIQIAKRIRDLQRNGQCHIVVIDEKDVALQGAFLKKFESGETFPQGQFVQSNGPSSQKQEEELSLILHRVTGARVLYDMPEAAKCPLNQFFLVQQDSYLLNIDCFYPVYMWVGSEAEEKHFTEGIMRGKAYIEHHKLPKTTSICRIKEDHEPVEFKKCFCDWRDKKTKIQAVTRCFSAGNVGRALFSKSSSKTVAKLNVHWSDEMVADDAGPSELIVHKVVGDVIEEVRPDRHGIFSNGSCYIIRQRNYAQFPHDSIYVWVGSRSTEIDRLNMMQLALKLDDAMYHQVVLVRVLDGKEPQHFLTMLQNSMVVYDKDCVLGKHGNIKMFSVREFGKGCMRVQQAIPKWSSLNSSASFVIVTSDKVYLWYGKDSGGSEREYTKRLLEFLSPSMMYSFEIITEGKESPSFLNTLGVKEIYPALFVQKKYERRPPTLAYCESENNMYTFSFVEDFSQHDFSEEDILVFDTFDQVFIWVGKSVEKERRMKLEKIAKEYIQQDHAARQFGDISLWFISQKSEPEIFTRYFSTWEYQEKSFGGHVAYETARKKIRQNNAKIDLSESVVDISHLAQPKYAYKDLIKRSLPDDVDDLHKERHLTDKQFKENLKVTRSEFYRLPDWKQLQILKSARLFYAPPPPRRILESIE